MLKRLLIQITIYIIFIFLGYIINSKKMPKLLNEYLGILLIIGSTLLSTLSSGGTFIEYIDYSLTGLACGWIIKYYKKRKK